MSDLKVAMPCHTCYNYELTSHRKLYTILPSQENADKVVAYPNRDRIDRYGNMVFKFLENLARKKHSKGATLETNTLAGSIWLIQAFAIGMLWNIMK